MTPGHDRMDCMERTESGDGSWEHRQNLTQTLSAAQGAPADTPHPTPLRDGSRLSRNSSVACSAAATPTHYQHGETEMADARVTVFHPAGAAVSEQPALASGSTDQVA